MSACSDHSCACQAQVETASAQTGSREDGDPSQFRAESCYAVPGMDCPAEERLIRLALQDLPGVGALVFDLRRRELRVQHDAPLPELTQRLQRLGLGARLLASGPAQRPLAAPPDDAAQGRVLRWLLGINALMFVVELLGGWLAQSTGLMADALDMLADAAVYGLALQAVGQAAARKRRAAPRAPPAGCNCCWPPAQWPRCCAACGWAASPSRR